MKCGGGGVKARVAQKHCHERTHTHTQQRLDVIFLFVRIRVHGTWHGMAAQQHYMHALYI